MSQLYSFCAHSIRYSLVKNVKNDGKGSAVSLIINIQWRSHTDREIVMIFSRGIVGVNEGKKL